MAKVKDVLKALSAFAPLEYAASYDNVGFLVGKLEAEVKSAVIALDITGAVIDEAIEKGANLIVSHHPVIFSEAKRVTDETVTGRLVIKMIENGISAICMHTNLDCAVGGVNDVFAAALGLKDTKPVDAMGDGTYGGGRFGLLDKEADFEAFTKLVSRALSCNGVRFYNAGKKVLKVAVGGGSCGSYLDTVKALGCDTFVTADIKHNTFLDAAELGINVIDAGHFATEDIVCPKLLEIVSSVLGVGKAEIAENDADRVKFFTER